jgi:hypothetical protein
LLTTERITSPARTPRHHLHGAWRPVRRNLCVAGERVRYLLRSVGSRQRLVWCVSGGARVVVRSPPVPHTSSFRCSISRKNQTWKKLSRKPLPRRQHLLSTGGPFWTAGKMQTRDAKTSVRYVTASADRSELQARPFVEICARKTRRVWHIRSATNRTKKKPSRASCILPIAKLNQTTTTSHSTLAERCPLGNYLPPDKRLALC